MSIRRKSLAVWILILGVLIVTPAAQADEPLVMENSIGMKLVRIPAGTFVMGSPRSEPARTAKEERHEVTITKSFYMGVYEVTQAQYVTVMEGSDRFRLRAAFKNPTNPIESVEWKKAKLFCARLSARTVESSAEYKVLERTVA